MAVILADDFNEYATDTQIQTLPGWAVYGSFPSDQAAPKVNAAGQLYCSTTDGAVGYYNVGSASHYCEAVVKKQFSGSFIMLGPAVNINGRLFWISVQAKSATTTAIVYRNGGGTAELISYAATPVVIDDLVRLEVDDDARTVELFINGESAGTPVSIAAISTPSTNAGFFSGTNDALLDDLVMGTLVDLPLTIDNDLTRKVYCVEDGVSHSYDVSGTYTTLANPIKYRVTEFVSGDVVIDWTLLGGVAEDNVWSGTIEMPIGPYYKIEYRVGDDTATVVSTERIGFGKVIEFAGQSNTFNLMGSGTAAIATDNIAFFDGSTYVKPSSGAYIHALNAISAANNNCVIVAYTTAVSATTIEQHLPGGSNYDEREDLLTAVGGKLSEIWLGQGESNTGTATAIYILRLGDFRSDILTRTGQDSDTLRMYIVQLGRNAGVTGSEAGWQGIRNAQTTFANETDDVYISHQSMDLTMTDGLHRNSAGYINEALRFADTVNFVNGVSANSGRGPIPTSATFSGTDVTITHNLNGSAALTVPVGAENLYELTNDDFSTSSVPTSAAYEAPNKIILTFASIPSGTLKLRSHQGQDFTVAEFPTGDKTYDSQAVMVEPVALELAVTEGEVDETVPTLTADPATTTYNLTIGVDTFTPPTVTWSDNGNTGTVTPVIDENSSGGTVEGTDTYTYNYSDGTNDADELVITVNWSVAPANTTPAATITADDEAEFGATVTLTGGYSDADDDPVSSWTWRIVIGTGTLSATDVQNPTLTGTGVVQVGLIVNDGIDPSEEVFHTVTFANGEEPQNMFRISEFELKSKKA